MKFSISLLICSPFSGRTEFDAFRHLGFVFFTTLFLTFFIVFTTSAYAQAADPTSLTPNPKPVEMLDAAGIDASLRVYFVQGKPWDVLENETLVKILHRLPDFPQLLVERWSFPWGEREREAVEAASGEWQGQFFRVRLTVLTVQKVELPAEAQRRFGFGEYYRVQVELTGRSSDVGRRATIFAKDIPQKWGKKARTDAPVRIDQPGSAIALFLKTGELTARSSETSSFYFATDRIAWHPKNPVGQLGMDVGLFDLIHDRKSIDAKEREPFYRLLDAVSRAKPGSLRDAAAAELGKDRDGKQKWTTAAALFNRPEQIRGHLVLLRGNIRRALRIEVRDPDIVERFGIRHYYELYLFTPDSQNNPIVVCVRDLPKGMPIGSGPDYCEPIEVAGVYFKSWAFTPEKSDQGEEGERQLAPLLVGRAPIWLEDRSGVASPWTGPIVTTILVVGFFFLWYFLRRQAKADRSAKERRQESEISL